jgi:hypothetical protein
LFINGRVGNRSQGTRKGFGTPRTAGYIKWRHKRFFGLIREEDEGEDEQIEEEEGEEGHD